MQVVALTPDEGEVGRSCPVEAGMVLGLTVASPPAGLDRPGLKLAVACVSEEGGDGVSVRVVAELEVARLGEPEVLHEGMAEQRCQGCAGGGWRLLATVAGAIRAAVDDAAASARLSEAPDDELVRIIAHARGVGLEVLLTAVDIAGDRRLAAAVQPLLALLSSEDRELLLRVIGALGRIGDTAAVRALGRLALSPAPEVPHVALRAIADIGGPEALRALELVANQSTDPVVAREADELIREMEGEGED